MLKARFCAALMAFLVLFPRFLFAVTDYYVSPSGNDADPGTEQFPFKTIQRGINAAVPGSTIHALPGTYAEAVRIDKSGDAQNGAINITGDDAVIDLAGRPIASGEVAGFEVFDQHDIVISGFEIRGLIATKAGATPVGILIQGACQNIEVSHNVIHHVENKFKKGNAHGIAVFGTGQSDATACRNIVISDNELHSLKLGASEALVVNGNVDGFSIDNNWIHDCNNIGIDAIGFEGISGNRDLDQARNGIIQRNRLERIDTKGNPAYGRDRSAGGIYVDGGTLIEIRDNLISECNIGIELASEHRDHATSEILVKGNTVTGCHIAGLALGGYDKKRGGTQNCIIENNVFRENDSDQDGNGELWIQYYVKGNTIRDNVFWATDQNVLITNGTKTTVGNSVNHNTYFTPGGADDSRWSWNGKTYKTFLKYQQGSQNDADSVFEQPPP